MKMFNPPHAGGLLKRLYFDEMDISVTDFASGLGVSRKHMSAILNERAGITPDMAVRLSMAFNTTPQLWIGLQSAWDLSKVDTTIKVKRYKLTPTKKAASKVMG